VLRLLLSDPNLAGCLTRKQNLSLTRAMKKTLLQTLLLCASFLVLSGCSYISEIVSDTESTTDSLPAPRTIELFLSRASLTSTDFEQYKLSNSSVYFECGEIRRGRFLPRQQEFIEVAPELQNEIFAAANTTLDHRTKNKYELDPPGKNKNLADPGIFTLTIVPASGEPVLLPTSLDSITERGRELERNMERLAKLMRKSAGNNVCGSPSFYGLQPLN